MFTGIIESLGAISEISKDGENIHFKIECDMAPELQVDQSISHNGICLTVVAVQPTGYKVTAIKETLDKTNLGKAKKGDLLNLERAMKLGG